MEIDVHKCNTLIMAMIYFFIKWLWSKREVLKLKTKTIITIMIKSHLLIKWSRLPTPYHKYVYMYNGFGCWIMEIDRLKTKLKVFLKSLPCHHTNVNALIMKLNDYIRIWTSKALICVPKNDFESMDTKLFDLLSVCRTKHMNLNTHDMKTDGKCMKLAGKTYSIPIIYHWIPLKYHQGFL